MSTKLERREPSLWRVLVEWVFVALRFAGLLVLLGALSNLSWASSTATRLFDQYRGSVYQVQVIDNGSNSKTSIGSGFLLRTERMGSLIATNYHVVAAYMDKTDQFRVLVVDHNKEALPARVVNFDVVHDLALLALDRDVSGQPLQLERETPRKGDRIYSLGNPFDLAMTIIEGIYNGPVDGARYEQYLFSGSLNGGMSGGPALNTEGRVIGINVAKGEEQISFLVPVSHLATLAADDVVLNPADYHAHLARAVTTHLGAYYDDLLARDWPVHPLGGYQYPDAIDSSIKCWGHTLEKDKSLYDEVHRHCQTQDTIYLDDTLSVGHLGYDMSYVVADGLNRFQFYNLLAQDFSVNGFQYADETQVTPSVCLDDVVGVQNMTWRVTTCARQYKRLPGLYDAELIAQRIDRALASARMTVSLVGIGAEQMRAMHRRFLEHVRWEN